MLIKIKNAADPRPSEITPREIFYDRRRFMQAAAIAGGFALLPGLVTGADAAKLDGVLKGPFGTDEDQTSVKAFTSHNNFYEFGTGKGDPKRNAGDFKSSPWTIEVAGHAANTGIFDVEDIVKAHKLEERIYRLRCVEAWSMVVPWIGIKLADVIKVLEPTSKAKYVAFETLVDETRMSGQRFPILPWPYREGLRMDEAMNDLTLLAVGAYGETMAAQNGAPIRLVVPWKYGFKSIKSIVKIDFVEDQPPATWNLQSPCEYGFFSNVNPNRSHPRWNQAKERRITGASNFASLFAAKIPTLMFNGYEEQVAQMYTDMDLMKQY